MSIGVKYGFSGQRMFFIGAAGVISMDLTTLPWLSSRPVGLRASSASRLRDLLCADTSRQPLTALHVSLFRDFVKR